MNAVTKVPAAYRPTDLGNGQKRSLEDRGWVRRTKHHHKDCALYNEISAYLCKCQEKLNAE